MGKGTMESLSLMRDAVERVYLGIATKEEKSMVWRFFGEATSSELCGIVMGISMCLREIDRSAGDL